MAVPALTAHFLVVCRHVSWDGPTRPGTPRTLEGVSYVYQTDEPNGFPCETTFWLFARLSLFSNREVSRDLRVSFIWHDDPELRPEVWIRPFPTSPMRPATPVRDVANDFSTTFEGPGRYEFRLWHPAGRRWDGSRRRRTLARAFINMKG